MRYGHEKLTAQIYKGGYECFSIGRSHMGRELLCIKKGSGSVPALIVGAHHGREYISSWFIMRELERINVPCELTLYALPMLNPDGVEISLSADPAWKANGRGVDLNRNYPTLFFEKVSEPKPCMEGFKGYYPASEADTAALMSFAKKVMPHAVLTFHAKGEEILYGDDYSPQVSAESLEYARLLASYSGYKVLPPSHDRRIYGAGFENWVRAELKRPCLLIELAPYDGSPLPYPEERFSALTADASGMTGVFLESLANKVSKL